MGFLYILGWISLGIQITFLTLSIVAGLYYLAELAEEYTTQARRCILFMISFTVFVYIMLMIFEEFPWSMLLCGFVAQGFHLSIMGGFPFIRLLSVPFLGSLVMLVVNHFLAFQYFTTVYLLFTQVLAYFTVCMWIVPFALFVSLSANDSVLPTVNKQSRRSPDVVSNYFSRNKKQGLLSLFNYMKEQLLPARSKKGF
ncbi:protein TEX261-like [Drosophila miranda]|uniref:protein TEX261-like n=1 Tax=Drosophila miranda TaxID=7229 RepID=UPI00143F5234|nr:protein TEX261-like [Drosophila miranda]XP_033251493.1 protein TEX261-like [Drosophila miranda]